ncbi:hypothetical protein AAGS61_17520 [Lysinibacillus sp. KU-BSD001]|uniref:hypothetical protein n=1 Tax=Lysinibacillus sp. KU-BSD001 TaxID=3141328 RepID=UPI0036E62F8A
MKKIFTISLLMCLLVSNSAFAKSNTQYFPQDQPPSILELAFLRDLGLPILDAMSAHGNRQLFTFERIEKIKRNIDEDTYDVTLRVVGYEGAMNPPYKLIRITFRIPDHYSDKRMKVISYKAKDITPEEVDELSKNTR